MTDAGEELEFKRRLVTLDDFWVLIEALSHRQQVAHFFLSAMKR